MSAKRKDLKCLICGVTIIHAHMGIDSCRACAVFYKRSTKVTYGDLTCIKGTNECASDGKIIACRKCRFDRFKEVFDRASASGMECSTDDRTIGTSADAMNESNVAELGGDPISGSTESLANEIPEFPISESTKDDAKSKSAECIQIQLNDEKSPTFIDHDSYYDESSHSDTPLLDKMKREYGQLCRVRKSGEMSALHHTVMHEEVRKEHMPLRPTKYSDMVPYSKIFLVGVMDFAKSVFKDFREMSLENRHDLVRGNFQLIQSIDGSYRGHHNFPKDDTVMATYATYVNDDTLMQFFDDCPSEVNKEEAVEQFRKNMKRTIKKTKEVFGKVKPSVEEFIFLFGFAIWNDYTVSFDTDIANLVKTNREVLLKELKAYYTRKGLSQYAPRMGELLCVLTNEERVLDLTNEDIEMYRTMNLFNEAYEDKQ